MKRATTWMLLLGFVRPNQVHVELIDPAAVLNEIVRDTVAPELLKHVEVVEASQQTSGTLQVRMDRGQLQQVALNLIVNACQAMQGAAALKRLQLSVRCAKVTTDALGKWHLAKENQEVAVEVIAITVTDSGPGISAENLSKVFEPFFTTKEPGQGTGLGLYIASSILQVWGGQLSVTSVLGEGSSFTILLPKP